MRFVSVVALTMIGAPLTAQEPARWEYGQLVTVLDTYGREDPWQWSAGDSTVQIGVLMKAARDAYKWREFQGAGEGRSGARPVVAMLNLLATQGWELISTQNDRYLFRRRKSA